MMLWFGFGVSLNPPGVSPRALIGCHPGSNITCANLRQAPAVRDFEDVEHGLRADPAASWTASRVCEFRELGLELLVHRHMHVAIKLDEVGKYDERPLDAFDDYNPILLCR
jgi:hypothetical protein